MDHQKARQDHKKINCKRMCGEHVLMKANRVSDMAEVYPNSQQATHAIKGIQMMSAGESVLREVGSGNSASLKH
jgi:hypothetical protein